MSGKGLCLEGVMYGGGFVPDSYIYIYIYITIYIYYIYVYI